MRHAPLTNSARKSTAESKIFMTKAVVCGGRDYREQPGDFAWVSSLCEQHSIEEIVSGAAQGADSMGESFARRLNLPVKTFPANWTMFGKSAGFIRNRRMAVYADIVIAFPGGKGTANMVEEAKKQNKRVFLAWKS